MVQTSTVAPYSTALYSVQHSPRLALVLWKVFQQPHKDIRQHVHLYYLFWLQGASGCVCVRASVGMKYDENQRDCCDILTQCQLTFGLRPPGPLWEGQRVLQYILFLTNRGHGQLAFGRGEKAKCSGLIFTEHKVNPPKKKKNSFPTDFWTDHHGIHFVL